MNDKDLKIQYTRGHGPGGQHKNKVETCVTVIHVPTGLKVTCQDTRSKNQNLVKAKQLLSEKIIKQENDKLQKLKNEQRIDLIHTQQIIRTYNYQRNEVYDHRTKNRADLKKFMKGEIDL